SGTASGSRRSLAGSRRWACCARRAIAAWPGSAGCLPLGWPSTTWSGCGGSWRSRHEDGRAASAARHVDPDTRSSPHGLLTPGSHAPEYGLFTSFFRSLLAGKKHFVDLAVQFGECAVGLLEKLFSPWVGFNNCQTVREMRNIIHGGQLRTHQC